MRIKFNAKVTTPPEEITNNIKQSETRIRAQMNVPAHNRKLAIVAGGPSIKDHLIELRNWKGDIWSINHTGKWLSDREIPSTVCCLDPFMKDLPPAELANKGLFASRVNPNIFNQFGEGNYQCFDLWEDSTDEKTSIPGGTTMVNRTPVLAIYMGYRDVSYFGCEGSFPDGQTHIDRNETQHLNYMKVVAGGVEYLTRDDLCLQCEELSEMIRQVSLLKNRSGGLLQAMIDYPDTWEITEVSEHMYNQINFAKK